jgi:hypothetical protein
MMSRVILVAMLPPSGATLCDLLAAMDKTTPRTGTSNLAQDLFSRPLAVWMYSTERPRCPFEEIGTVRSRKPGFWVSMEDVAESVRDVARQLGGDAIIGVNNSSQINGGTVIGGTVNVDTDLVLSGTVIRFKDDECRE